MDDLVHGLRTPNEAFFLSKSQTFGLGQTIRADKFWGIWGIFGRFISIHFGKEFLVHHYFYKTLSLCIQIPNIYLGFEFGPQRIRDLAIFLTEPEFLFQLILNIL